MARVLPSRAVFLTVVTALLLNSLTVGEEALPLDAKKVVDAYEKETTSIRKEALNETSAAQDRLLKKLRELQVALTKAAMLDEAVLVRDSVRGIEADEQAARLSKFDPQIVAKLPAEAQVAIREYENSISEISKSIADKLSAQRTGFNVRLQKFLDTYTAAGKLDEALAIRSRMSSFQESVEPASSISLGEVGSEFEAVQKRYRELTGSRYEAGRKAQKRMADALILELAELQKAHTKAGRLDPALAIRTFNQNLAVEQNQQTLVALANSHREKLPADAVSLVDGFLQEVALAQTESERNLNKLHAAFLPHLEVEARKQLLGSDLEAARKVLTELYRLKQKEFPFAWARHYRVIPDLSSQAQPIFERFTTAKDQRLAEADSEQVALRKHVLELLEETLSGETEGDARQALEQTIEVLKSESTAGVLGTFLIVTDRRLPEVALTAIKELRSSVKKLVMALDTENAAAVKELVAELIPVRETHVAESEWEYAFTIFERQQNMHRIFVPIPVKVSPAAGHPFYQHGSVVDAKDGLFLVNYSRHEEWMTRDRFRVGNEPVAIDAQLGGSVEPRLVIRSPFETPTEGPGRPVTEKTEVKVGQRLLAYWASRWLPVTALEVGPAGIKIHWEGYSDGFDEVVERARLRDASED